MRTEELKQRQIVVAGWPLNITSYRAGSNWHCVADNVSPGAVIARTSGATREAAEDKALSRAGELLRHTRVQLRQRQNATERISRPDDGVSLPRP